MNEIGFFNETEENLDKEIKIIEEVLNLALEMEKVNNAEFNIIFVDEEKIQEINKTYRNIDKVTDVISFALEDTKDIILDIRLLGDIYICVKRAHEQAESYEHSFEREIAFLSVHGLLHLLGYDHMEKDEEEIMFKKQEEVLTSYGLNR